MRGGYVLFPPFSRAEFRTSILTRPAAFIGNGQFGFVFQNEFIIKLIFVGKHGQLNIVFTPPERLQQVRVGCSSVDMLKKELDCYRVAYVEGLKRFKNTLTPTILAQFQLTNEETVAYLKQQDPTFELPADVTYSVMIIMEDAGINIRQRLDPLLARRTELQNTYETSLKHRTQSSVSLHQVQSAYAEFAKIKDECYAKIRRLLVCLLQVGIIHGDHTLENIMFNPVDGQFRLIDFGMSTLLRPEFNTQATALINAAEESGDWASVFMFMYRNTRTTRADLNQLNNALFKYLYTFEEPGAKRTKPNLGADRDALEAAQASALKIANRVAAFEELFPEELEEGLVAQLVAEASALDKFAGGKSRKRKSKRSRTRRAKQRVL